MKVLFIGFDYHEYTRAIKTELEGLGFECAFYSIQPGMPHLKVARRLSGDLYQALLDRYHRDIIDAHSSDVFDYVIFLQVHQMSVSNIEYLKSRQQAAKFVLYNWDAVSTHDYRDYLKYFDSAYTFDPVDAESLGIGYLPLFATRRYQGRSVGGRDPMSVYFVGNIVNPERYRVIRAFETFSLEDDIRFEYFMSTTVHGWTRMWRAGIPVRDVSLRQLAVSRQDEIIDGAAAVFDFANHSQTGFTMRVMENLCAGKKIITNNARVRSAPFYSEDRFLIYDGLDFSGVREFLARPLLDPDADFSEYHVQSFAARLIGNRT